MQGQQKISASVQVRDSPIIVRILMRHEGERFHPHLAALVATSSFFLLAFFAPSFCIRMYKNIPTNPLPRLPPPFFIFLQNFLLFFFPPKMHVQPLRLPHLVLSVERECGPHLPALLLRNVPLTSSFSFPPIPRLHCTHHIREQQCVGTMGHAMLSISGRSRE